MPDWTIKTLLDWISPYLQEKEVDAPRLCAELLMCHVLGKQRMELYTQFDAIVPPALLAQL
ncbi:MAG: peptide chain release factor N(5)-glutamine methyltransferase, partial [Planctomycetes bacterium]|nr:peptide chain release factor N(5)-glutamine methyltransferase [Planctomycetota bacterium]